MQKVSLIICLLAAIPGYLHSQENNTSEHKNKVALKFAPAGLAVGKITFGGEYNFSHRNSFTFHAGVPFDKTHALNYDGIESDITSRAFSLMTGYRHYLGHKTMSGFYIEPYVKYLKVDARGLINMDLQGQTAIFDSHAQSKSIGIGAQLGVQFLIAKLVVFDLFLLGPEANSVKAFTKSTDITDNLPWTFADAEEVESEVKENLKDIPFIGDKIGVKVDVNKKTIFTDYSGFMTGLRAGASIGIKF